jgi:MHS family proline/betaine transporter-like MFS transporter
MSLSHAAAAPLLLRRRTVAAGVIGNLLEWFDFAVYGYLAATIAQLFFPAHDPTSSLIAALGVFAAGFLMRPLGGLLFGYIGDRHGRPAALLSSIGAMALATLLMGLLPTYESAGVAASLLMIACRLVQGLAVGGEYACSIVALVETAPTRRRGAMGSIACLGATLGTMMGSATGALLFWGLSEEQVDAWGWRLPFLAGVSVGLAGLYLRCNLVLGEDRPRSTLPFFRSFLGEWRAFLRIVGLMIAPSVGFYMIFLYLVQYLQGIGRIGPGEAFDINTLNMAVLLMVLPAAGHVSDRIGRRPLMIGALAGLLVLAVPLFTLLHSRDVEDIFFGQLGLTLLLGTSLGLLPVLLVEQFSLGVRCMAAASSYNVVAGLFGGTAPLLCVYMIELTGNDMMPAYYLAGASLISLATAICSRETAFGPLRA